MRLCRLSPHHEGVLGIGHLVVSLFRRCMTFCKECKICSRWHWLRYRWIDQWSWLIAWVRYFLNVANERTCFASCASAFKSTGQRSKLTFSKRRLLATFNCKMVAIKTRSVAKKKFKGRTLHDVLHKGKMRRKARFLHFALLQKEKEKEETV